MTEKDLDEFEKEYGFKLLPTSFKKPLSEITKEEYRERIEWLYNAIINDDSNDDDLMEDMTKIIFLISFIVLYFVNISFILLGYYYVRKAVRRFEKLRKKEK